MRRYQKAIPNSVPVTVAESQTVLDSSDRPWFSGSERIVMELTDEMKDRGRRNFLKAIAGAPALAALGVATVTRGPVKGGPVKAALIGTGDMGSGHLRQCRKEFIDLKALCDINPKRRQKAADILTGAGWPEPKQYDDCEDMLEREDLEAVIIATPLWTHADIAVGCMNAGKHVLSEKMMAKSEADCLRMIEAARRNKTSA